MVDNNDVYLRTAGLIEQELLAVNPFDDWKCSTWLYLYWSVVFLSACVSLLDMNYMGSWLDAAKKHTGVVSYRSVVTVRQIVENENHHIRTNLSHIQQLGQYHER